MDGAAQEKHRKKWLQVNKDGGLIKMLERPFAITKHRSKGDDDDNGDRWMPSKGRRAKEKEMKAKKWVAWELHRLHRPQVITFDPQYRFHFAFKLSH